MLKEEISFAILTLDVPKSVHKDKKQPPCHLLHPNFQRKATKQKAFLFFTMRETLRCIDHFLSFRYPKIMSQLTMCSILNCRRVKEKGTAATLICEKTEFFRLIVISYNCFILKGTLAMQGKKF